MNNTSFVPKDVFYVRDNRTSPATLVPAPLTNTYPISASYTSLSTQTTSSINVLSYADMTIQNMKTFIGENLLKSFIIQQYRTEKNINGLIISFSKKKFGGKKK